MNGAVIQASHLSKTFPGGVVAVNNLDLEISPGAVYGMAGRNGSGKTTTLRLLMGLLQADHGAARVFGWDFWTAPRAVRMRAAYVAQSPQLPGWMSLEDLCRCLARFHVNWDKTHARDLARAWELPWKRSVGSLSNGEQRKVAVLLAFASRPDVLVLDEPASGFDLVARRELLEQIVDAITRSDGCTVLLSTHVIADLERVADHIGVIEGGRMKMSVRLEDLLSRTKRVQVIFAENEPAQNVAIPGVLRSRTAGSVVNAVVQVADDRELDALRGTTNARVQIFPIGLEEIFLELFGRDDRNGNELVNNNETKERE